MLAPDGSGPARARRAQPPGPAGTAPPPEQIRTEVLAALRGGQPPARPALSRLAAAVMARGLVPAARALAAAVDISAGESPASGPAQTVTLDYILSPACLTGACQAGGSGSCHSVLCQHDCHSRPRSAAGRRRQLPG
jgi:hypothetical protein